MKIIDKLGDCVKLIAKRGSWGFMFCSLFHVCSWWQRIETLAEEKEAASEMDKEKTEMRKKNWFKVKEIPLFYSIATDHFRRRSPRQRTYYPSVEKETFSYLAGEAMVSEGIENVDHDSLL